MLNGESNVLGQELLSVGGGDPFSSDLITAEPVDITPEATKKEEKKPESVVSTEKQVDAKEKPESKAKEEKAEEPEKVKGTASYILAKSYQKDGLIPEDEQFGEDISAKDLKKLLLNSAIKEAETAIRSEYEEKFGDDLLETANMLRNGVDPEDIKEINSYKRIAAAELGDDEDRNAQITEIAIKAMYQDKGLSEKKINKLYEDAIDEDEGASEFAEAKRYFASKASKMEKEIKESQAIAERTAAEKQESINKDIKSAIKSGDIYGVKDDSTKKKLEKFLFDQDEVVKIEGKTFKVTGFQKALQEYNSDIKKQLTFAKLLMDGFNLSDIEEAGKAKASDELDNLLEGHVTKDYSKENTKTGGNKEVFDLNKLVELL